MGGTPERAVSDFGAGRSRGTVLIPIRPSEGEYATVNGWIVVWILAAAVFMGLVAVPLIQHWLG
jgi:hypothetical protein